MTKKKQAILIIAIIIALIAAVVVLALLNAPKGEVDSGTVTVVSGGETLRVFSLEDISAMDHIELQKEIVSSSHANDEGLFRGVTLRVLLSAVDEELAASAAQIVVRSEDGFVAAYPADEVMAGDSVFLAYSRDGEGLGTLESGGTGPFRVIVADDEFGNRCAKYVYEIEIK